MRFLTVSVLGLLLAGCASLFDAPELATADRVSETEYDKCEGTGVVVPDPVTGRPMFVLGQYGCDRSSAPAVTVTTTITETLDAGEVVQRVTEHEQEPLQAEYNQTYTIEADGTEITELEIRDGHSNCGSFGLGSSTNVAETETELSKTYGMGLCSQDIAIGIAESLTDE